MKKIFLKYLLLIAVFVGVFAFFGFALAQPDLGVEYGAQTGLGTQDIRITIANIIRVALGLLGIVALVIVLWGGFMWMTAGGNEEKVATAKKILFNGLIGLILILSSYAITSFVISRLSSATGFGGGESGGGGPSGPILPGFDPRSTFTIQSKPSSGNQCIANYHPIISFTKAVDIATVQNRILIKKGAEITSGEWKYLVKSDGMEDKRQIFFAGTQNCGDGGNDCLEKGTEYTLEFIEIGSIKSTGGLTLSCGGLPGTQNYKCGPITFKTGSTVDLNLPTVELLGLPEAIEGDNVRFSIKVTDDAAVGYATLNIISSTLGIDQLYTSQQASDCQKEKTFVLYWPSGSSPSGIYDLLATGFDKVPRSNTDSKNILLKPKHCINGIKDADETGVDCGGSCGKCDGGTCEQNFECTSGACLNGVCASVMRIIDIDPKKGDKGNYVGIFGRYFGNTPGKVYFASKANPSPNNISADWKEATVVECGLAGSKNWFSDQIIVEVPEGFYSQGAAIMVKAGNNLERTANTIGDGSDKYSSVLRFSYEKNNRPNLCAIIPTTSISSFQTGILFNGKNFGNRTANDRVKLRVSNDVNDDVSLSIFSWGENGQFDQITVGTPRLDEGRVSGFVYAQGQESNSLLVRIKNTQDPTLPLIDSIMPSSGNKGQYITITGKNFGSQVGEVRFYKGTDFYLGSFDFPENCDNVVWTDNKIVVKAPNSLPAYNQKYLLKIITATTRKESVVRQDIGFTLTNSSLSPGICAINPMNGEVGKNVEIYGEHFGNNSDNLDLYFWKNDASTQSVSGRAQAVITSLENNGQKISSKVPAGAISGPVVVYKKAENLMSNPVDFKVDDCTKNVNLCDKDTQQCCTIGADKGSCKLKTELCAGTTRSTGYMWRFTTAEFPKAPRVLKRCDENLDCLKNSTPCIVPSPSPLLERGEKACLNSLITIAIDNTPLDGTSLSNNILLYKCDKGLAQGSSFCQIFSSPVGFTLTTSTLGNNQTLLTLTPANNWDINSFYQVILKGSIRSLPDSNGRFQYLAKEAPCDDTTKGLNNTAYCFVFETGDKMCELQAVSIIPNSYWTGVLESPIKIRNNRRDLEEKTTEILKYSALGLARQKCMVMDLRGYDYEWSVQENRMAYASIPENSKNVSTTPANALKNTVAIGLVAPTNSLYIFGKVSTTTESIIGRSLLTIDLSNPQLVDWAPRCLTACPNAEVFIKFDKQMSSSYEPNAIILEKCENVSCTVTSSPGSYIIDTTISHTSGIFALKNITLATNTYYKVTINSGTLFTIASATDPTLKGQPFKQKFAWMFGTKDKMCEINKVEIKPTAYYAYEIDERNIFSSDAYSAPDECSATGQKLNPYGFNWLWTSSNLNIAQITTFTYRGDNPFCTDNCLKKGSTFASGTYFYNVPMCGNGILEAGEDCEIAGENRLCDNPFADNCNCSEKCLFKNKIKTGSCTIDPITKKEDCRFCGNGKIESEEDCDLGIIVNSLITSSSLNCAKNCLHTGTPLSSKWCDANYERFHEEPSTVVQTRKFEEACRNSVSQCGNEIVEPNEECEGGANCTNYCLDKNQKSGSSLIAETPSRCGDAIATVDEVSYCETKFYKTTSTILGLPFVLAEARGANLDVNTPLQTSVITGAVANKNKSGTANFYLVCGAKTDADCVEGFGRSVKNSCCYPRPQVLSVYPLNGAIGVCPNTDIKISFKDPIDIKTLAGNLFIARGQETACPVGTTDVTSMISLNFEQNLPWYKKVWFVAINFVKNIFGIENASAQKWCSGEVEVISNISYNAAENSFDLHLKLVNNLKGNNTSYKIILGSGVRDDRGVGINTTTFSFTTWNNDTVCTIGSVEIIPKEKMFTKANTSTVLLTNVKAIGTSQIIVTTTAYSWEYIWSKDQSNAFVINSDSKADTNIVTSRNQNGEGDVFVVVKDSENKKASARSHITVFLCENPWPPFEVIRDDKIINVWPFDDTSNNKDYFNFNYNPETTETGFIGIPNTQGPFSNFSTFYCADAGVTGKKDDLPYMKPVVTSTLEKDILKYYLLTNDKNADAIGIKIASNTSYLSLSSWLANKFPQATFNSLKIDGYEAAVDSSGNNVYVAGLNYNNADNTIYSNIYIFSLSLNARPETKNVFDQILANLKFNVNLNPNFNRKMCASDWNDNDPQGFCNTDLDCLEVPGKPLCLNQKEKMQRNFQRMKDGQRIKNALGNYKLHNGKYPTILENTFLPNRAFSVWQNSWNELGSQLQMSLPLDPINKLAPAGTCLKNFASSCIQNADCGVVPSATGLVGYWAGENNFIDGSVRRNDGIGSRVSFASGVGHGQSFSFPSGYEKITIKHQEDYNLDFDNFAISFWFKPTEQTPAILIKKGGWSDTASNNTLGGFMVEYNKLSFAGSSPIANNGTIRFAVFPSSTDPLAPKQYFAIDTDLPLTVNQWHHIIVRYAASGLMYLVVDGKQYNTVKTGSSSHDIIDNKSIIKIGKNNEDIIVGEGLKGQMDEIYIYARTGMGGGVPEFNAKFENICHLHDSQTGWSAEDRRFSFACADKSMAYAYITNSSGDDYSLRGTRELENLGNAWAQAASALNLPFNGQVILDTFCEAPIISNNVGKCGNGILNDNEQCDPPGKMVSSDKTPCQSNPSGSFIGQVCNGDCLGTTNKTLSCTILGRCGDGKVQSDLGEKCDDGENNGRPGFCGTNCQPATILDTCGDGKLDSGEFCDWNMCPPPADKRTVYYSSHDLENYFSSTKCVTNYNLREQWAVAKDFNLAFPTSQDRFISDFKTGVFSCNSNCTGYGPYCGDSTIQSGYGEECEREGSVCTKIVSGQTKSGVCKQCKCDLNIQQTTSTQTGPAKCGDGEIQIEEGEECDLGSTNGNVCIIPTGFSSCSWCSTDCKIRYNTCPAGYAANQNGVCLIEIKNVPLIPILPLP